MKLQEIKKLTILELGVDINIKSRAREVVFARAVYYKLCREFTKQPLSAIGREVGKDHATVLYGINLFDNVVCEFEIEYVKAYDRIKLVIMNTDSDKEKYLSPNIFYKKRYLELEEENRIIRHKFKFLLSQLRLQGNKFTDKKEFQI